MFFRAQFWSKWRFGEKKEEGRSSLQSPASQRKNGAWQWLSYLLVCGDTRDVGIPAQSKSPALSLFCMLAGKWCWGSHCFHCRVHLLQHYGRIFAPSWLTEKDWLFRLLPSRCTRGALQKNKSAVKSVCEWRWFMWVQDRDVQCSSTAVVYFPREKASSFSC